KPKDEDLRSRLRELGGEIPGVVVTDGESGELAGALALAAGRFQGISFLAPPRIGSGAEERTSLPEDFLSQDEAWGLAAKVREALVHWGLSSEDRWPGLTLA